MPAKTYFPSHLLHFLPLWLINDFLHRGKWLALFMIREAQGDRESVEETLQTLGETPETVEETQDTD